MGYKIEPKFSLGEKVIVTEVTWSSPPEQVGLHGQVLGIQAFIGKSELSCGPWYKYLVKLEDANAERFYNENELNKI